VFKEFFLRDFDFRFLESSIPFAYLRLFDMQERIYNESLRG